MSEPKKQHYVPQIYLERFAIKNSSNDSIYTLHKDKRKIICTNTRDTASERHINTIRKSSDNYLWEKIYSEEIEPLLANITSRIISKCDNALIQNCSSVLTQEMKELLAISIMFQLFRGKASREFQYNFYNKVLPSVIKNARKVFAPIDEAKENILSSFISEDDNFKQVSLESTFNLEKMRKYIDILLSKKFLIYRIIGDEEFITSDNPVMFINGLTMNVKPFTNGLLQKETIVFFPLSPKLLVAIYDINFYFGFSSELDSKIIFIDSYNDRGFIKKLNFKQYEQCFNQVYSRSKNILENINYFYKII